MHPANPIDTSILLWLNHWAGRSGSLDSFVYQICDNDLAQAAVPVTILWYLWFRGGSPDLVRRTRERVVATLIGASIGLIVARGLALLLPFRTRPIATPGLGYHPINPRWSEGLYQWSSFPSDHAVLFFALATGITLISRRLGILMLCYAALVDCLPRVYLGYHYPSDILAGALLGVLLVRLAASDRIRGPIGSRVLQWAQASPGLFYAAVFVGAFEISDMFDSGVRLARVSAALLHGAARRALAPIAHSPAAGIWLAAIGSTLLLGLASIVARRGRRVSAGAGDRMGATTTVPLDFAREPSSEEGQHWWRPELLEFTHDAIIIWEMDGAGILYWNAAAEELYGFSRDEARGHVTHTLLRTQLCGGGGGTDLEPQLARFGVWVGELVHTTREGRRVEVEARLALLSQRNGRWLVLEANRDVTDRTKARAEGESTERQLACLRRTLPT